MRIIQVVLVFKIWRGRGDSWALAPWETRESPLLLLFLFLLLFSYCFVVCLYSIVVFFFFHIKRYNLFSPQRLAPSKSHLDLWVGGPLGVTSNLVQRVYAGVGSSSPTEAGQGSPANGKESKDRNQSPSLRLNAIINMFESCWRQYATYLSAREPIFRDR